jgi:asparagine synthetase B (glutamine-hydrolysing)
VQVLRNNDSSFMVNCTSTVLALRGGQITLQPFIHSTSKSLFCWNGEAWEFASRSIEGNDGQTIFDSLVKASSQTTPSYAMRDILEVLRAISGPFAFFFLDHLHSRVYFGRDRLGRRSLLVRKLPKSIEFASVSDSLDVSWQEVEADGIYSIDLSDSKPLQQVSSDVPEQQPPFPLERLPWDTDLSVSRLSISI